MECQDCILYDWFTASFPYLSRDDLITALGMDRICWADSDTGSRLRYGHRMVNDGISVHYTDECDHRHNPGVCLEMSGQGCRDFETFGHGNWSKLFDLVRFQQGNITRIDIAFDDFSGLIPLRIMAEQARRYQFTARSQHLRITEESIDGDPDHMGISVCHGSKSSEIFVRCYDKRVERQRWEVPHWVRLEVQLRAGNAAGFVEYPGEIGEKFRGVLAQYLNYRCPDPTDSNKRRWFVAPWWQKLLEGCGAISVHSKKEIEYNKSRLEAHIERNHNAIKTSILSSGLPEFLEKTFGHSEELPDRYTRILQANQNSAEILKILNDTTAAQIIHAGAELDAWEDAHAVNAAGL